ncbi:MAG: hypothetical protein HW378_775, partial [Anaerolineales bacterium]|nr:hypothetical protein [Anaerolineales bacterium]
MRRFQFAVMVLQAPPPVQLTLDLGFLNASGNSEVTTLNL